MRAAHSILKRRNKMVGVRLVTGAALGLAVAAIVVLLALPLEGWLRIAAIGGVVIVGACGVSLAALLAVTMFKAADDPWDSSYFRYMRAVWGDIWGGKTFQINVCRANWLGVITLFSWLIIIGILGFYFTLLAGAAVRGVEVMNTIGAEVSFVGNLGGLIILTMLAPLVPFGLPFLFVPWLYHLKFPRLKPILFGMASIYSIGLIIALVVAPIRSAGILSFLIALAWIFGVTLAGSAIYWTVVGTIKLGIMCSKRLRRDTAPGRLIKEERGGGPGIKQRVCPSIIKRQ
jgi:hypothetical protein